MRSWRPGGIRLTPGSSTTIGSTASWERKCGSSTILWQRAAAGGSATIQATTRVNAEQASYTRAAEADPPLKRGRLPAVGKRATRAPTGSAGVLAVACMEEGIGRNTGSPAGGVARANRQPARVRLGRQGGGEVRSTKEAE